jgi:hypothetical protein
LARPSSLCRVRYPMVRTRRQLSPTKAGDRARGRGHQVEPPHPRERVAKSQWCTRCPVLDECLAFAFESESEHVVLGGTTSDERRRVLHLPPIERLRVLQELLARQCVTEGLVPSLGLSATRAQDENKGQDGGEHGDHDSDLHTLMIPPEIARQRERPPAS